MSCGVDRGCGLDPALLGLWCRLVATVLIGLLAWEPPYAAGVALKRQKNKKLQTLKGFHFEAMGATQHHLGKNFLREP